MKIRSVFSYLALMLLTVPALATTYGSAESDWRVSDNNPSGASLQFVHSALLGRSVLETNGSGHKNGYFVGATSASSGWNNTSETLLTWRLRTTPTESTSVYVRIDTTQGWRWLRYNHATNSTLLNSSGRLIHHGLGATYRNGDWNTWTRNLDDDLAAGEPGNTLTAVHGVMVRGNVQLDRIDLTDSALTPPVVAIAQPPLQVNLGDSLTLNGDDSNDPDGAIVAYSWRDTNGNEIGTEATIEFVVSLPGTQQFLLEVSDDSGLTAMRSVSIEAVDASQPVIYSDAESGDDSGWRVSDKNPSGALVRNIVDPTDPTNQVMEFVSDGTKNSFINGSTNPASGWNNTLHKFVQWRSLASENFRVYVRVETASGWRFMWYDNRNNDILHNSNGKYIHHGLGTSAADGRWQTFTRDLQADLADAEPDNILLSVQAVVVRGSFLLDDLELRATPTDEPPPPSPPPVPLTPINISPVVNADIEAGETVVFTWQAQAEIDTYDFHLFDRTSGALTSLNALSPAAQCDESICSLDMTVGLPVSNDHAWRVRARNESGVSAWSRTEFNVISVVTAAPDAPVLSNPTAANVYFPGGTVDIAWLPTEQTSHYEFALLDDTTDTSIDSAIIDPTAQCTANACTHAFDAPEEIADNYRWQVRAVNAIGTSDWVSVSFDVIEQVAEVPPIPVNLSPAVGEELIQASLVRFNWQASDTASYYDFHFFDNQAKDELYTNGLDADTVCENGSCSVELIVELPLFTSHAWRVRAGNVVGQSAWSRSVFDVVEPPVPPPVPVTPINLSPGVDTDVEAGTVVTFVWAAQPEIDSYDFHLFDRTDGSLTSINALAALELCNEASCSLDFQVDLPIHDNHAWRVRARNESGLSAWSRTEFNVIAPIIEAPPTPVLTSPSAGIVYFPSGTVVFSWLPTERTSSYAFAMVNTDTGTTIVSDTIDPQTHCTTNRCDHPAALPDDVADSYVWQVRSVNAIGASAWAKSPFSIVEAVTEAPPVPTNISPEVGIDLVRGSSVAFQWQGV